MLSLREFAKLTGYSRMTVSRVFSEDGKVAEETREKVLKLAEKHNFRPCTVIRVDSVLMAMPSTRRPKISSAPRNMSIV